MRFLRKGKVKEVYEVSEDELEFVFTDRLGVRQSDPDADSVQGRNALPHVGPLVQGRPGSRRPDALSEVIDGSRCGYAASRSSRSTIGSRRPPATF